MLNSYNAAAATAKLVELIRESDKLLDTLAILSNLMPSTSPLADKVRQAHDNLVDALQMASASVTHHK